MERSHFDGTKLQLFGYSFLAGLLTAATLGIGYPWAKCIIWKWEAENTTIEDRRLQFTGTGLQLFKKCIIMILIPWGLLLAIALISKLLGPVIGSILLLGFIVFAVIYGYWFNIEIRKWHVKHLGFTTHMPPYHPQDSDGYAAQNQVDQTPHYSGSVPALEHSSSWLDKIEPFLPAIYVLWFCGIAAGVFYLLYLLFA